MESHNMLALSTGHLTEETADELMTIDGIIAYEKGEFGFFVYVPDDDEEFHDQPADIHECIEFAHNNGYDWIMFDRDVETINELPVYEW